MATTQQYSLRWNNYYRHLTSSLDNLRTNDEFVDVSLCCDGRRLKAHKIVLSSCSGYFREIFSENPHPHPVIIFKFIKFDDLNSIIQFMYQGEVNVQQEALQSFLQTAELLAVQGLTAEEKDKNKTPLTPLIAEQKLNKTIPSTIRPFIDASTMSTATTATTTTQTIEIPSATILQHQNSQLQSLQQQQQQQQQQQLQNKQQTHIQHIQIQSQQPQTQQIPTQLIHHHHQPQTIQQSPLQQQPQHQTLQSQPIQITSVTNTTNNAVTLPRITNNNNNNNTNNNGNNKKRKLTFSDDEHIYTTESVDDQTLVKIKMDIPEYIVSEVDESEQLSEEATPPNTGQDSTGSGSGSGNTVSQYPQEYEILTESETDEKFIQNDTEITIEMNRILSNNNCNTPTATVNAQNSLAEVANNTVTMKTDPKTSSSAGVPNETEHILTCIICLRKLRSINALRRHMASRHTEKSSKNYECSICHRSFKTKWSLSTHNSRYHRGTPKESIQMEFVNIEEKN